MTKDDVLRMALEAGFPLLGPARTDAAMRFAALMMEEDAKVCENLPMQQEIDVRDQAAAAIRARKPA